MSDMCDHRERWQWTLYDNSCLQLRSVSVMYFLCLTMCGNWNRCNSYNVFLSNKVSVLFCSVLILHWISRFAQVNVNKVNFFVHNRVTSTWMLFHSMYTFIILTMLLSAQRNNCRKRTKWSEELTYTLKYTQLNKKQTSNRAKYEGNHVTFLHLFISSGHSRDDTNWHCEYFYEVLSYKIQ